ncbi:branched-chain amino acid transport system ATP-binding protein [Streptosporangium album]|uniref:Branched-chain amino acid transport system ATP-binding protein n=1 Tax=Streptosporangium album TaxID=47479 RepID=A0A7W7S5E1_9ACTN|nr:ABC transporter ATP-binding protein [Streptosporangium album]MBB4944185.1 branched-chain amino acid transport system ATP-binding protein [Streptosporangium album]
MLELEKLSVSYGPVRAVNELSLRVPSAGAVAILGPNGAGKTSTLRAISGLVPHGGAVLLNGRKLSGRSPREIARTGVIQVPEGRRVFGSLSVEENLHVGMVAGRGRERRFSISDVYDLLPALARMRGRAAWALSGGEQQMLAVGRALVASPEVLLLDEPSLGLAPAVADRIYDTFRQLKGSVGLVIVEQMAARALAVVDEVFVLREGETAGAGAATEFADPVRLARLMIGVHEDDAHPAS